jgi:succinoglycan biosynthesis transport protein ExoP
MRTPNGSKDIEPVNKEFNQSTGSAPGGSGIATQHVAGIGGFVDGDAFGKFVQFLRKRGWLIVAGLLLGLAAGVSANVLLPKTYTAKANIEVTEDKSSEFRLEQIQGLDSAGSDDSEKMDTEIEILRSRSLALETVKALHLEKNPDFTRSVDGHRWSLDNAADRWNLAAIFESDLKVLRLGHTTIIEIYVTSKNPMLASLMANTLIDRYIEHSFTDNYLNTKKISGWLTQQLGDMKENLEKSQEHMLELQKDLGVFTNASESSPSVSIKVASLEEMNKLYADAQVDRLMKEAQLRAIQSASPDVVDAFSQVNPALQNLKVTMTQLRTEYTSLIQTYGPAYPRVKALKAQIDDLQKSLQDQENAQVQRAQKEYDAAVNNEAMLHKSLDTQEQGAYANGDKAMQFEIARRDYETNRLLYDGLQERLQESTIMSGLHSTTVHIVDSADSPINPSHPRTLVNLAAALSLGLLLGLGSALTLEGLDTNLKTMAEIEQALQLPLMAAIPSVESEALQPAKFKEVAVMRGASQWSRIAEALRGLRTSIQLSSPGAPPKVIMMTSTRPAEGKSSISSLLAITFALNGSRVLLVDCDLRRPAVHFLFRIGKSIGLSSVLTGKATVREAVHEWPDLPNLHIMPAGPVPPLPSELLGSAQMETLAKELRAEYDLVIFDTPPVLAVTDATILGRLTDATILIIRYGAAQRHVVQRTIDMLERTGSHMLGVVVNVVDFAAPEYAEYYGRKYYEYYGERNPE